MKGQSTYAQRLSLYELGKLTKNFIKNDENTELVKFIIAQKKVESLHNIFFNIAILMQGFWELHSRNCLDEKLLNMTLKQFENMIK